MPDSSHDPRPPAGPAGQSAGAASDAGRAAVAPSPEPVSAAANPLPLSASADSPAEAQGRRTLSTAFVMVGPDGQMTVELRDGRTLVLRDVAMRPRDYCGIEVQVGAKGRRYCGGYAEIAGARPGGSPSPGEPDLAAPNPAKPAGRG